MITKDGRDTPIEKLTADNYIVPKGEEKDYHAVIEVVQFDQKTGKRISRPRVQKFGKKTFEQTVLASLKKQGYTVTILHDPNKWLAEQREKAAKAKAEQEQAKTQAEKEKFDAAVAAAVEAKIGEAVKAEIEKMQAQYEAEENERREKYLREHKESADPAPESDPAPAQTEPERHRRPGRPAQQAE